MIFQIDLLFKHSEKPRTITIIKVNMKIFSSSETNIVLPQNIMILEFNCYFVFRFMVYQQKFETQNKENY